ncbi:hypothetical protein GCK32_005815 [Trichostrongylus colubriformis]|uniref:G protein-coupled receptor n=1 Tax=Trichostrongylus colubriformis TaxID=6319 RepID=A0AAN8FUS2_TRICO
MKFGYNAELECVSGTMNINDWRLILCLLHITVLIVPVYIAVIILRKLIMSKLSSEVFMSESTRRMQSQLLMALTVQASLPTLYLAASSTYLAEQLWAYRNQFMEYLPFILLNFTPMLTPLTSIYFIGPYRDWMENTFLFRAKAAQPPSEIRIQAGRRGRGPFA